MRDDLHDARRRLQSGREEIRQQHAKGLSSFQVCARLTDLVESVVRGLWDRSLADLDLEHLRGHVALVPHGGFGRRDIAPFSDVDLMLLHDGRQKKDVAQLATRLLQDVYDVGLELGNSVRSEAEALQLARDDAATSTSLMESRFMAGNEALYRSFRERFTAAAAKRYRSLYEAVVAARREERIRYGETVYLLRPNVKKSAGGLRGIQLLRWLGFARFGAADPDRLYRQGALSAEDRRRLKAAHAFLLRTRNELHFHAGKPQDQLDRGEQVRLAEVFGYRRTDGLLPVEQFMRDYFRHTSQVRYLAARFVESVRPRAKIVQKVAPIFSHQVEGDYRVGPRSISATRSSLEKLRNNLEEVLRLADLANLYDKRIDHATWSAVCRSAANYSDRISDETAARFLSILSQPARLGEVLRRLHELGVLERIVPFFRHARCLLQFNEYHQYTVDEHCLRAVEAASEFGDDPGPIGQAYWAVKEKRVLHLALLLHDLGKGFPEDHSEVGRRIADAVCRRLRMAPLESEMVKFLVHQHLALAHMAFRRDTSDEAAVVRFAVQIGSPEVLRMLYVLTCADFAAVGPGVLNDWKVEVLTELYHRLMHHLSADAEVDVNRLYEERREAIRACARRGDALDAWSARHIDALPRGYLRVQTPEQIVLMLGRLRQLPARGAAAWGEYLADAGAVEFTVVVDEGHGRGVFYRLAGALSSQRLQILSAEINSLAGEAILDRFVVHDPDFAGPPPPERIEQVCRALVAAIAEDQPPKIRAVFGDDTKEKARLSPLETNVKIDNRFSATHTIIEVFTFDRPGLLYTIAHALFDLNLSIGAARIGTYLDQVVDVFYVTEQGSGRKIESPEREEEIRARLCAAIRTAEG